MSVSISVDNVEYATDPETKKPILYLFGRDTNADAQVVQVSGFRPYFYIRNEHTDIDSLKEDPLIADIDPEVFYDLHGNELYKVYVESPYLMRFVRQKFIHYEADVPFTDRFVVDYKISGGIKATSEFVTVNEVEPVNIVTPIRTCYIDIECNDANGFPKPARDEINCITCYDNFIKDYTVFYLIHAEHPLHELNTEDIYYKNLDQYKNNITVKSYFSETLLLEDLVKYVNERNFDIFTGWNVTSFDMPYIMDRMNALEINPTSLGRMPGKFRDGNYRVKGRSIFDLLEGYKKLQESKKPSYRLDAIGEEELGERKVHYKGSLHDLWRNDPSKFIEYNVKDVNLCVRIDEKNKIIDFYRMIAHYVGCSMETTLMNSRIIDLYMLRFGHGRFVYPSKAEFRESVGKFKGASVLDPSSGLEEWVIVLDLRSLYPMIMMTLNASPETKSENGEYHAPNGISYKAHPIGLTKEIMQTLLNERDSMKAKRNQYTEHDPEYNLLDLQQQVIKRIMNTYYGVSGFSKFRLHDQSFGASVTSVGRAIIEHSKKVAENMGFKVIYGDTDSIMVVIYVKTKEEALSVGKTIEIALNESYDKFAKDTLNVDQHYFHIKFEKLYRRFFQTGVKKRYVGHLIWKEGVDFDKIAVTGFETERSDSPLISREVQKALLKLIVTGRENKEIKKYLSSMIKKYRGGKFSLDEIGIPGGIQKDLTEYVNQDAHIRGAEYANKYLNTNFKNGSKPKRVYIKYVKAKYPKTDVICFEYGDDVPGEFVVDLETMLEKTIRSPIEKIINTIGLSWVDIDPSMTTLAAFGVTVDE